MDVESQKTIDEGIDRASAALSAALTKLQSTLSAEESEAISAVQGLITAAQVTLSAVSHTALAEAVDGLHGLLDRVSGATVDIVAGGFKLTIPPRPDRAKTTPTA